MKIRDRRALARLGTVGVIAGTALAFAGAPAYAADATDLRLGLTGTTIAATSSGKTMDLTITNAGGKTAVGVVVAFDLSALEQDKVEFVVPTGENGEEVCDVEEDTVTCGVEDIPAGQSLDLGARLTRKAGTGAAGQITVAVAHDGTDTQEADNTATVKVSVGDSGPDLFAYAPDVPFNLETNRTDGKVAPGGTARLFYVVGNQGDEAATGVTITVTLPKLVTFVEVEEGCEYNAAKSVATCTYENLPLVPEDEADPDNDVFSAQLFYHDIKVDATAEAPSTLTAGVVAAEPLVAEGPDARRAPAALPDNVLEVPESLDVDPTDNSDEFSVYVARAGGAAGGDGDGDGGTLPITGAKVGVAGGVGLAVVIGGVLLLLSARRRRVVLVAPQDETPTA
jgi:hypothetical protein